MKQFKSKLVSREVELVESTDGVIALEGEQRISGIAGSVFFEALMQNGGRYRDQDRPVLTEGSIIRVDRNVPITRESTIVDIGSKARRPTDDVVIINSVQIGSGESGVAVGAGFAKGERVYDGQVELPKRNGNVRVTPGRGTFGKILIFFR